MAPCLRGTSLLLIPSPLNLICRPEGTEVLSFIKINYKLCEGEMRLSTFF